uniref:Uncharacterized protein n=1 Tax=Arion vulgaris TaxID=1028688 RepID=A0A0B7BMG6_9EUPU
MTENTHLHIYVSKHRGDMNTKISKLPKHVKSLAEFFLFVFELLKKWVILKITQLPLKLTVAP